MFLKYQVALILLAFVITLTPAHADQPLPKLDQTFQYAVKMEGPATGKTAYLWVPEKSEKIRGLLIGGQVIIETDLVRSKAIRDACRAADLGIVYMTPHPFAVFPYDNTAVPDALNATLKKLATISNHPELADAPLMPFGHSVSTLFAQRIGYWNPDRVFGIMLYKGGLGKPLPSTPDATHKDIPLMLWQGQFEEFGPGPSGVLRDHEDRTTGWRTGMAQFLADRTKDPALLYGYIVEPGGTHYEWPIDHEAMIAEFITASAALRLPDKTAADHTKLKSIDYKTQGARVPAAKLLAGAKGKKQPAVTEGTLWYPSQKLADAVVKLHDRMALTPQYVAPLAGKKNNPIPVGHDMRLKLNRPWFKTADSVKVKAGYTTRLPKKYPKEAEGEVTHSEQPVRIRTMAGNITQIGPDEFRVTSDLRWGKRIHVAIWSSGDATFRPAAQHARLNIRYPFRNGDEQTITFTAPKSIHVNELPYTLKATATSDLPVSFYIDHGPAILNDQNQLTLDQWPAKAGNTITVNIVAYQVGSMKDPLYKTAPTVTRTITLTRK